MVKFIPLSSFLLKMISCGRRHTTWVLVAFKLENFGCFLGCFKLSHLFVFWEIKMVWKGFFGLFFFPSPAGSACWRSSVFELFPLRQHVLSWDWGKSLHDHSSLAVGDNPASLSLKSKIKIMCKLMSFCSFGHLWPHLVTVAPLLTWSSDVQSDCPIVLSRCLKCHSTEAAHPSKYGVQCASKSVYE